MTSLEEIKFQVLNRTRFTSLKNEHKSLVELLYKYWGVVVPNLYRPVSESLSQTYNDDAGYQQLIKPLEWYITQNEFPKELFEKIKAISKQPSLCGKVFKVSEPNYNCRDCAMDPTCVLCSQCFMNR